MNHKYDIMKVNLKIILSTNKDQINEKARNNKIICECGSSIRKDHEKRHYETKKHKKFMEAARDLLLHYTLRLLKTIQRTTKRIKTYFCKYFCFASFFKFFKTSSLISSFASF